MEWIIKELESHRDYELMVVGLTPSTDFKGTQEDHDNIHNQRAGDYQRAIDILKSKLEDE